jgi:transposase
VPLSFAPGEAYQFDWSHEVVVISGATVTVKVAQVRLCHSRMLFAGAHPRETQEMVFDAHDRAFSLFKGACTRGIKEIIDSPGHPIRRQVQLHRPLRLCKRCCCPVG